MNENKPYELYQALFAKLFQACQGMVPGHKFSFNNPLYSLDSATIDLCLSVFPWAKFRTTKGAIKLHVGLNHSGHLPEVVTITEAKVGDVTVGRSINFSKGSMVAIDRGYNDYSWYKQLTDRDLCTKAISLSCGVKNVLKRSFISINSLIACVFAWLEFAWPESEIFFRAKISDEEIFLVTRLKSKAKIRVPECRPVLKSKGLICDETIQLTAKYTAKKCLVALHRIEYRDTIRGKPYIFLTTNFKLAAKTIADIYKARWDVELFFKWIKQNLKIKSFIGTTRNAVMIQIWIALCMYLLHAFIKFQSKLNKSMQQILRLLPLKLFEKRDWPCCEGIRPLIKANLQGKWCYCER